MKSIYIGDRLHRQAKLRAAELGIPLNQLIAGLVERGLLAQATPLPQVTETPLAYRAEARPITGESSIDQRLVQLASDGILSSGQHSMRWLEQAYLSSEPVELLEAAQIRDLFDQQRARHPDTPTVGELLREMREDGS